MSRGMPSMVALLGLLAVAGYQNRDKIKEMLDGLGDGKGRLPGRQGGLGDLLGGGASAGGVLSGGLGELIDRFKRAGQSEAADSWVSRGQNKSISSADLERAIGPEVLDTLATQTGLSREELLARLTRDVPPAVDKFTPEGRVPTEAEAGRLI